MSQIKDHENKKKKAITGDAIMKESKEQQKVSSLIKLIDMQKKLLQERKAYKEGLPLDFYEEESEELGEECVKWPYDYTFIRQLHYMYEQVHGNNHHGKSREELLEELQQRSKDMNSQRNINVFMVCSTVGVFFVNNTIFVYSSLFMFTVNLFVETMCFLYMAKYFQYDGSDYVALVMQLLFYYLSHRLLKSVLKCFGADEDEYVNLSWPEVKVNKLKSYILAT